MYVSLLFFLEDLGLKTTISLYLLNSRPLMSDSLSPLKTFITRLPLVIDICSQIARTFEVISTKLAWSTSPIPVILGAISDNTRSVFWLISFKAFATCSLFWISHFMKLTPCIGSTSFLSIPVIDLRFLKFTNTWSHEPGAQPRSMIFFERDMIWYHYATLHNIILG